MKIIAGLEQNNVSVLTINTGESLKMIFKLCIPVVSVVSRKYF